MSVYEAILKRRTIRKFKQNSIPNEVLLKLVDAARLAPQGGNLQPLKYVIVTKEELLYQVFEASAWASYIRPDGDPQEGEKPVAYIVVLVDTDIKKEGYDTDAGAAVENLLLVALEEGLGAAWLGGINRKLIKETLELPDRYLIHTIVALGYPAEEPLAVEAMESIKYYKDEKGVLHVPKRTLKDIVFFDDNII